MLSQAERYTTEASMAESVTRHAQIPEKEEFRVLLCGIDTLDLGLYVTWGRNWEERLRFLNAKKLAAQKESGGLLMEMPSGRKFTFQAGGKGNNYRFHLEFPGYHLFIGKAVSAEKSPNVFLSTNAKTLWLGDLEKVLEEIEADLKSIGGGSLRRIQPSRCDLTADFLVPGGFSLEFLQSRKVTRSRKSNSYLNGDKLETFYAGDKGGTVQLRIYDKSAEVARDGKKPWFWKLWGIDPCPDVWRVEFQLRRPALKQYGVNSLPELDAKIGGIWKDLTERWFSLRLPGEENTERRTVDPFWEKVKSCAERFGPATAVKRDLSGSDATSIEWHLSHIDGCLASIAARRGIHNRQDALQELISQLSRRSESAFTKKSMKKAISLGLSPNGGGDD